MQAGAAVSTSGEASGAKPKQKKLKDGISTGHAIVHPSGVTHAIYVIRNNPWQDRWAHYKTTITYTQRQPTCVCVCVCVYVCSTESTKNRPATHSHLPTRSGYTNNLHVHLLYVETRRHHRSQQVLCASPLCDPGPVSSRPCDPGRVIRTM
ncbi:hypothetical protein NHX12_034025 [Muraenolepis orangiensis]|uniref:Uncharacterized protein n=1 Tax=Muraenolepis orangiensis TaxID=630683 RepID=A0A9Q0IJ78_9TELE|nr:hypothetical protein NHX12_034025 [Muraenolepis orangiensis]